MVSVRLWVEPRLVVSTRRLRLMAIQDLRAAIAQRRGPRSPAELVSMLAEQLTEISTSGSAIPRHSCSTAARASGCEGLGCA
jgi:hypothetical protein